MTFEQIIKELKNGVYRPIYLLMGEEPFFIDEITNYIVENVLSAEEKDFNQTILYGKDIPDASAIVMAARRYPMMSKYQVIVVKEAQNINNLDALELYANTPLKSTILVINYKYKTIDKRKKLYKSLDECGVVFDSKKLYDDKVPTWITSVLNSRGLTIEPRASVLLAEYLGSDLSKIYHEIEKLQLAVGKDIKQITTAHVQDNIGISKEYNIFELQKAIFTKNISAANKIILVMGKDVKKYPIQPAITLLFGAFQKLIAYHYLTDKSKPAVAAALKINPFFVGDYEVGARNYNARKVVDAISLFREYDMKSKGFDSATNDTGELLKELIFKLMH